MRKETLPAPVTTLLGDEAFLATYWPDLLSFAQRSLIIGLITAVFFAFAGLFMTSVLAWPFAISPVYWLPPVAFMIVILAFIFDDYANWLRHRSDLWHLTSLRLLYENDEEPELNAAVNLADIHATYRKPWKNLRVDLETGQSVMMKYLKAPKAIEREIDTARTGLMGRIADPLEDQEATK